MASETEKQALQFTNIGLGTTGDARPVQLGLTVVRWKLRFTATYTQGATAGVLSPDSPYNFSKRLQLQLGGGFTLRDHDSRFLKFWNQIQRKGVPNNFVAPNVAANAVSNIFFEEIVDLAQPDMIPGFDRAFEFDTRLTGAVNLVFDWGVATDIASNASSLTVPQMTVTEVDDLSFVGRSSQRQISRQQFQSPLTASGDNDMLVTAGGPAYRAIVLSFRSGNADPNLAAGDDTFCNNISLIGDNNIRYWDRAAYQALQQENKATYNMQGGWPPGYVILDRSKDGTFRSLLLTQRRKNPLVLRVNLGTLPSNPVILVYLVNDIVVVRRRVPQQGRVLAARR